MDSISFRAEFVWTKVHTPKQGEPAFGAPDLVHTSVQSFVAAARMDSISVWAEFVWTKVHTPMSRNYNGEEETMPADLLTTVREALAAKMDDYFAEIVQIADPLSDAQLWKKPVAPGNSIGHLILHLTGNLNHFAGARLGGTGYVREREREFTESQHPSKATLIANLKDAVATFRRVITGLSAEQLVAPFPEPNFGNTMNGLMRLVGHFALHRGQMTYLARLVGGK